MMQAQPWEPWMGRESVSGVVGTLQWPGGMQVQAYIDLIGYTDTRTRESWYQGYANIRPNYYPLPLLAAGYNAFATSQSGKPIEAKGLRCYQYVVNAETIRLEFTTRKKEEGSR